MGIDDKILLAFFFLSRYGRKKKNTQSSRESFAGQQTDRLFDSQTLGDKNFFSDFFCLFERGF
jgi:hypothetical protein